MLSITVKGIRSVLRGAALALSDPRRLARIGVQTAGERELAFERRVRAVLGEIRTVPIEHFLIERSGELKKFSFLDGTSTVPDLLLLQSLARRFPGAHYFEIGTFRGESAAAVADSGAQVVTLSLPDERLKSLNLDPSFLSAHRAFSREHPRIQHVYGDSSTFATEQFAGWADVIFIDGDHSCDAVERDTKRFWPVRREDTSVVVWHDAFSSPLKPRWEVLAGIVAGVPKDSHANLVHVSNTQCMVCLPEAATLPDVKRSYDPRIVFGVSVVLKQRQ
jgi:predicted O-methyltransferase YrrM